MPKISRNELISLQRKLRTDQAIGEKFGITRQAIHQLRKRYGIDSSYAGNPRRNEKIVALYKKGSSGLVIARRTGLSVSQTYRIIKEVSTKKSRKKK